MAGSNNKCRAAMTFQCRLTQVWVCFLVLLGSGCEDRRMNNMIGDQVYLNESGENVQNVFKGEQFIYRLQVIKSGVGQEGGEVSIQVDESILARYEGKYTLLPAALYKVKSPQISLKSSDYSADFEVEFDAAAIQELEAGTRLKYAIPFRLSSNTLQLASDQQLFSVVVPKVLNPYIQFKTPGIAPATSSVSQANSAPETRYYAFLQTNYNNQSDLQYKVEVSEGALAVYNKEHGTTHRLLPAAAYRVDQSSFTIANLNNEQAMSYYLMTGKVPAGEYMLPLEITQVSKYGIDPQAKTMLIPVKILD